jgi:hypothetical protein
MKIDVHVMSIIFRLVIISQMNVSHCDAACFALNARLDKAACRTEAFVLDGVQKAAY